MLKNKSRRNFYKIVISDPDSISEDLPYYQKCVSIGYIESLDLNIYKNSKLCFTIFVYDKSYIIGLECLPI